MSQNSMYNFNITRVFVYCTLSLTGFFIRWYLGSFLGFFVMPE